MVLRLETSHCCLASLARRERTSREARREVELAMAGGAQWRPAVAAAAAAAAAACPDNILTGSVSGPD